MRTVIGRALAVGELSPVPSQRQGKCVSQAYDARSQQAFAAAVCRVMRESRRRQKLTQAEVAQRTGGLVSKAALAKYETGHRSLRVDVAEVMATADPRLAPVKRWFELRTHGGSAAMTLDDGAIAALASLMNVSALECRRILISTIRGARHAAPAPLAR